MAKAASWYTRLSQATGCMTGGAGRPAVDDGGSALSNFGYALSAYGGDILAKSSALKLRKPDKFAISTILGGVG